MTDLERALLAAYRDAWETLIPNGPSHQVVFGMKIAPIVDTALAAARREGAEDMRERAARVVERYPGHPDNGDAIRALPLTPEEPNTSGEER